MEIEFHKKFDKQYFKLPKKNQQQFADRLAIFMNDRESKVLNIHKLKGSLSMYLSMNINSDIRALFVEYDNKIIFKKIGTHSELYK